MAKLLQIDNGIVLAMPSPRIRVMYDNRNHEEQKEIGYIGFYSRQSAETFYLWCKENRIQLYDRFDDAGLCKPRKAKRVENCIWEVKWHRPDAQILSILIQRDLDQVASAA